ncbi:MAG: class I SAM-dependent methyltransferase [Solirubrobacteraceae bacterium]
MRDYYEDLWGRLPEDLDPPDLNLRLAHLRAGVRAGDRVLDLGCGDGRFAQEIARMGAKPIGVEVAQAAIDRARAGHPDLDFRLAPIDGPLPLDDVSFDVVWTSEVIEHVADTARWLSEVRRVLVPRGRLLLTTPSYGRLRVAVGGIEAFSDPLGDHLHLYTRASLKALLAEFGFDEISVRTAGGPPFLRRLLLARAVR